MGKHEHDYSISGGTSYGQAPDGNGKVIKITITLCECGARHEDVEEA